MINNKKRTNKKDDSIGHNVQNARVIMANGSFTRRVVQYPTPLPVGTIGLLQKQIARI